MPTTRDEFNRKRLFSRYGYPTRGLENAMMAFNTNLNGLESMADSGDLTPQDLFRLRGNGHLHQPGKLAIYLFGSTHDVKSYAQRRAEQIENNCGAGI